MRDSRRRTYGDSRSFRTLLDAGVDQVALLSGYNIAAGVDEQRYTLTPLDAARAARGGWRDAYGLVEFVAATRRHQSRLRATVSSHQSQTLEDCRRQRLPWGTDNIEDVGAGEFQYLPSLDVFTRAELLRLWSEVTPQAVFPKRQISRIAPGYGASFILLARDPSRLSRRQVKSFVGSSRVPRFSGLDWAGLLNC